MILYDKNNTEILDEFCFSVSVLVVDKKFSSRRCGSAYYDLDDLRSQVGSLAIVIAYRKEHDI